MRYSTASPFITCLLLLVTGYLLPGIIAGSCPNLSDIPDPKVNVTECNYLSVDYTGGLACRISNQIGVVGSGQARPNTTDVEVIANYLKQQTGATECQCEMTSQCSSRTDLDLGEGFAFLVLFVEGNCGESGMKDIASQLINHGWSSYRGCDDWILLLFSESFSWIELGGLANDFIESRKRDELVLEIESLKRQHTVANETNWLPVVQFIVEKLIPDLETQFDGWMWIIIGISGALALLLIVLAITGLVCYLKTSGGGGKLGKRRNRVSHLDASLLTSSDYYH